MNMRLLLIEGVPGSGKTTAAKEICWLLTSNGVRATWYLEEAVEHPIHPRVLTRLCDAPDFADNCLMRWESFVGQMRSRPEMHIMEGSAFQSTVRFMMENDVGGIENYFSKFVDVVKPLAPAMIYLRPSDVVENSRYISDLRGDEWAKKVAEGETHTPYAVRNNLSGLEGMHVFWQEYACLCDSLLSLWTLPRHTIRFEPGNWKHHVSGAWRFLKAIGVLPIAQNSKV